MPRSLDGRWQTPCAVCGATFEPRKPSQTTCSKKCAAQLPHNTGGSRRAAGLEPRDCIVCGTRFQPYRANGFTCSRECYRKTPSWQEAQRRADARPERQARKNELRRGRESTKLQNRRNQLRRHYGVTVEQHDEMLAAQNGACAICGNPPKPDGIKAASRLHVDHDHMTGRVRSLLCNSCNNGIGRFRDDPALLRAAAEYIEHHRQAVMEE